MNRYFTVRNDRLATKHVFAGSQRVATKLVRPWEGPGKGLGNGGTPPGQNESRDRYFYHPDHLGSTNYVTDSQGRLYEHTEYFPFGEPWVEEHSKSTQITPYLFTGKEYDRETGLYYFGARYYDPRTSLWVSVDPLIYDLSMKSMKRSAMLNLYSYSNVNPLVFMDPDGREPNRSQATTWAQARQVIEAHFESERMNLQGLKYTEGAEGGGVQVGPFGGQSGPRYIWTEKLGWIDLAHMFHVAAEAQKKIGGGSKKLAARSALRWYVTWKLWKKTQQVENKQEGATRWSYEDAPSNKAGLDFFLDYLDENEELLEAGDEFFEDAGAASPTDAPNWEQMQREPGGLRHFEPNKSMEPLLDPQPVKPDE